MRILAFLLALLASTASGCVFSSGFDKECPVIIGLGNYGYVGAQILSSNGGADFLSPFDELFDGKPSTVTRISWTDDPQTTSTFTAIQWFMTNPPTDATPKTVTYGVVGVLNTSLPEGMLVGLAEGGVSGPFATTTMQKNVDGTTSAWFIFDNRDNTGSASLDFIAYNDVNGSSPMHAGDEWTVGEIFVGYRSDWKLKRNPRITSANTSKLNLSAASVQFPVFNPRVRQHHYELSPLTQEQALFTEDDGFDFESMVTSIMNSDVCAFIPFTQLDPAFYPATFFNTLQGVRLRARTAILGQLLQPPTTTGDGDQYYDCVMDVQESV